MSLYVLLDPAVHLADSIVVAVSRALAWPGGGASVVLGVVALTLSVRAALLPLAMRAARADRAREALRPELDKVRKRHAGDPTGLAREIADVHSRAGISPFSGLGPAVLQLPVLLTLYRVVVAPTVAGAPNAVVTATVLGGPLSAHWMVLLTAAGLTSPAGAGFLVVLALLSALAWMSSRQATARAAASPAAVPPLVARLGRVLPFATVGFAVLAPMGVGFYLVVSTAWTVAERALLPRLIGSQPVGPLLLG